MPRRPEAPLFGVVARLVEQKGISLIVQSAPELLAQDVQVYDFKRPERVSKDQMRALEALHEGFGRNFGAALSGYLRTIIEVSVAHIEQLTSHGQL